MAVPTTLSSVTGEDLLTASANPVSNSTNVVCTSESTKKEESVDDKDDGSGAVKANKGMILRKSVEYIRFVPSPPLFILFLFWFPRWRMMAYAWFYRGGVSRNLASWHYTLAGGELRG
jgi:hypothetical protein